MASMAVMGYFHGPITNTTLPMGFKAKELIMPTPREVSKKYEDTIRNLGVYDGNLGIAPDELNKWCQDYIEGYDEGLKMRRDRFTILKSASFHA